MRVRNESRDRVAMVVIGLAACCVLVLNGCSGSTDSGAQGDAAAAIVILRPNGWEPPMPTEAAILADRLLRRKDDSLLLDAAERSGLGTEIAPVLAHIRKACPVLVDEEITGQEPYALGVLLLGLEPQLYEAVASLLDEQTGPVTLQTGYAEFDSLNERLGLSVVVDHYPSFRAATFFFSEYLNVPAAAEAYEMLEGIEYAEPDAIVGIGSDIDAVKSEERWYVVARRAWGDCPSGCINEELFFFIVEGAVVEQIDHEQALERAEFGELVMNQGWQMRSFEGC